MPENLSEYEHKLIDSIEEFGWFCLSVGAGDKSPSFSYSIGFMETLGAPEFIVFGLPFDLTRAMLGAAFRQLSDGRKPRDGERWGDLIANHDCILKKVHPTNLVPDYFNSALWYHRRSGLEGPFRAMQIVWPGSLDGCFPWDDECTQIVRDYQTPLYIPNQPVPG